MKKTPWILGISASHNGSVCLLKGSQIVCAIQEERLTRVKRDRIILSRPSLAFEYCLQTAGIRSQDLDLVVVSVQHRESMEEDNAARNPQLAALQARGKLLRIPHHFAHAVSAYCTSGFKECLVTAIDGNGSPVEDLLPSEISRLARPSDRLVGSEIMSAYLATPSKIDPLRKWVTPGDPILPPGSGRGMWRFRSWGGLFSAASLQIFGHPAEAGKVMGLAAFGRPRFKPEDFFLYSRGHLEFHDRVPLLFPVDRCWPRAQEANADLASSVQNALETGLLDIYRTLRRDSGMKHLAYAGGVALNTLANQRIADSQLFNKFYVIPSADDSGVCLGAAFQGYRVLMGRYPQVALDGDQMGRVFSQTEVRAAVHKHHQWVSARTAKPREIASLLSAKKTVGWFSGKSELGPRALGGRSILADARKSAMKDRLNLLVKNREKFRPFAPIILSEFADQWFENGCHPSLSQFMLGIAKFKKSQRRKVPAVVHRDFTGRVQVLCKSTHPRLHLVMTEFNRKTGVPILINTSFNVAGEPLVETPENAIRTFLLSDLDFCVLENVLLERRHPKSLRLNEILVLLVAVRPPAEPLGVWNIKTPWGITTQTVPLTLEKILLVIEKNRRKIRGASLLTQTGLSRKDLRFALLELWSRRMIELSRL